MTILVISLGSLFANSRNLRYIRSLPLHDIPEITDTPLTKKLYTLPFVSNMVAWVDPCSCQNNFNAWGQDMTDYACQVIMSHMMLPNNANPDGNVHGGDIMKYIDNAAGAVAMKHARTSVVTAAIDKLDFHLPVYIGNLLTLKASLNATGRTSMEIGVRVEAEDLKTGVVSHIASAYLTFVALDTSRNPMAVPPYKPDCEEARRRNREAIERREISN